MKMRNPSSRQLGMLTMLSVWTCSILMLPTSFVFAQEEAQAEAVAPANEKIVGTWKVDLEKSKEVMSEAGWRIISQLGGDGIVMTFGAEGVCSTNLDNGALGDSTFTVSAVEGEENLCSLVVSMPVVGMKADNEEEAPIVQDTFLAKVLFIDENTIKFMQEDQEPVVMVRVVEEEGDAEAK